MWPSARDHHNPGSAQSATVLASVEGYTIFTQGQAIAFDKAKPDLGDALEITSNTHFNAPMNGTIVAVLVSKGDHVAEGDALIVIEAMKMQHTITAPSDGLISDVFYCQGDLVDGGAELLSFTQE